MKKTILLPIILGGTILSILLPTTLSNTDLASNENSSSIIESRSIDKAGGEFTQAMANDLVTKKQLDPSLIATDFGMATTIAARAFLLTLLLKK